ncbi:MAG: fumarylacetoacetate hydrolase family protein [Bryobacterales bacterium]|nr:fumarylacetoacetate hydrolase family protein [Bryobacterales bacterium]
MELAAVIGVGGRDVPAEAAQAHIAGFLVMNDFSARDIQKKEMKVRLGPANLTRDDRILPGDVIGSGTVGTGCGLELDRWVKPGDVMELEIEKIGVLRNRVIR